MSRRLNLIDQRFGRLVVASYGGSVDGNSKWICVCDCGNVTVPFASILKSGKCKSCGCFRSENLSLIKRKHGFSKEKEFNTWKSMIRRCSKKEDAAYKYYGAVGISVCDRWVSSFENFVKDMGKRPSDFHSLDRIDVSGNYEPSNCRWATKIEQANNKRNSAYESFNGETMTHAQWGRKLGLSVGLVNLRIRRGWSVERVLTSQLKKQSA